MVGLAFLGCGQAAAIHSKTLRRDHGAVQRFYASRSLERASAFNARFAGVGAFGSYEQAIESSSVQIVFVVTPPQAHLQWTLRALEAGKDVFVEKPAFLSSREAEQVAAAARRLGRRVSVAENYYYKPLTRQLRRLLHEEVVGEVVFVQINATKRQNSQGWRDELPLVGGGALFEGGIHWLNLMASLGPQITAVQALEPRALRDDLERSMLVNVTYDSGAVGSLAYSWEVPALINGVRVSKICGRQGSITFESNGLFIAVNGRRRRLIIPRLTDLAGYRAMFDDFFEAHALGREPAMSLALAKRDLELVEEAYASAARVRPVGSRASAEPT